jgi:hypothetical protein
MIELILGFLFLSFMVAPFTIGSLVEDTELPSIGLILLILAYLAYFNNIYLPIPSIINKGLIASFAIVDSIFLIFFGIDTAAFGAQNLIIFLISLSVTYSILQVAFSTIPTLNDRAKEFITLAVLFVIARTTVFGGINIIYSVGIGIISVLFPNCGAMASTGLYNAGFTVVGLLMLLFAAIALDGWMKVVLMIFGIFWTFLPTITYMILLDPFSFQFCAYFWVLQMAMVLFLLNWIFQTLAMDWMGGLLTQVGAYPRE